MKSQLNEVSIALENRLSIEKKLKGVINELKGFQRRFPDEFISSNYFSAEFIEIFMKFCSKFETKLASVQPLYRKIEKTRRANNGYA